MLCIKFIFTARGHISAETRLDPEVPLSRLWSFYLVFSLNLSLSNNTGDNLLIFLSSKLS